MASLPGPSQRKLGALEAMVRTKNGRHSSGVTTTERDKAERALDNLQLSREGDLAVSDRSEGRDVWTPQGMLICTRNGAQAYLRQSALAYFLSHVREGEKFNLRTVGINLSFGGHEFYTIVRWLKHVGGLLEKTGSRYVIRSIQAVKTAWNEIVTKQMIL